MRNAIPRIHEEVAALKERPQHEHDGHKKPHLQMLYLLVSRQAQTRQEVAHLLGAHRTLLAAGWPSMLPGGLDALLATHVPAGKPVPLAPAVLASLEQALHQPEGFAAYEALRRWVHHTHGVEPKYKTLYTIVRTRLRTKLKAPRPSHTKKS